MVQSVIIINNSNFNKQNNNGNSFIYKFPKQITFNPMDKIGIQSASLFNTFYNISSKLNNNKMSIVFPCNNPSGGSTAVIQGYIGNSVQFTGEIENPPAFEFSGGTILSSNTSSFNGFVGGAKITFTNAFISNTTLTLVNPNSAPAGISTGMYINGSSVSITSINSTVNGANTYTTYTLSNSSLSPVGSSVSPVNTIFACGAGKNLYATSTGTKVLPLLTNPITTLSSGQIFVRGTGLSPQAIKQTMILTSAATYTLLDSASNIYVPSSQITAGVSSFILTGTSTATVFNGMTFTYWGITYTITQTVVQGTLYTLTLDKFAGVFPSTTLYNVGIPNNSFSILTVSGDPLGNGIYLPNGSVMTLSGAGVNTNVTILGIFSSTGISQGVAGIYKISYNPNTVTGTMTVNDSVTNNNILYVNSLVGTITNGMIFKISGRSITIGNQYSGTSGSVGSYFISTPSGTIPSIYPQQLTASASFSTDITVPIVIPDGYYTADTLNKYLQQVMIGNKIYITDGINAQTSLFYIEITQNTAYYSLQVNIHPLPSSLSSSQALPIGASWTLINDGTKYNPQLIINEGLQEWFGFSSTTSDIYTSYDINKFLYIPKAVTTLNGVDLYYLSDVCPKVNTINSLVLCCNLINSEYSIPSNVFFNIPLNASFGNMIVVNPFDPSLCNVRGGMEQNIEISFFDTNFNPVAIRDIDVTLTLVIQKSDIY